MKPTKTECSNAWVDGLAASAASATPPSPPPLPHYSCRPCRYSLRRSGGAVVLRRCMTTTLATFRRKNALSDVGRLTSCAADMVLGGDFALVHSRARGDLTVAA